MESFCLCSDSWDNRWADEFEFALFFFSFVRFLTGMIGRCVRARLINVTRESFVEVARVQRRERERTQERNGQREKYPDDILTCSIALSLFRFLGRCWLSPFTRVRRKWEKSVSREILGENLKSWLEICSVVPNEICLVYVRWYYRIKLCNTA